MITGVFVPDVVPQPFVRVAIRTGGPRADWAYASFMLDTGAGLTCIHATDAMRVLGMSPEDLNPDHWPDVVRIGSLGGGFRYLQVSMEYAFAHDDGRWEFIDGIVHIGELESQGHPSLLGWDLLENFDIHINGRDKTMVLERL